MHLLPLLSTFATALFQTTPQQQPISPSLNAFPRLNFSSSSPLIFHSYASLLQTWANNFFPAGHTIAPCTIPAHTTLYHARADSKAPPPSPEWLAFDQEMSYSIFGIAPESHMLTFRTTKDVRCMYFDGASASLIDDGSLDSQMVFLHNSSAAVPEDPDWGPPPENPCPPGQPPEERKNCTVWNPLQPEYDRANWLCGFMRENGLGGRGWGYEGVVRMNAGFEVIWCDFESTSLELLSNVKVVAPLLEGVDVPDWPPRKDSIASTHKIASIRLRDSAYTFKSDRPVFFVDELPFWRSSIYDWFAAATKTYGSVGGKPGRGEARVRLHSRNLFSIYEPGLVDQERARITDESRIYNLTDDGYWKAPTDSTDRREALKMLTRRRRYQRALDVSVADGQYMRAAVTERLRATLREGDSPSSGVGWVSAAQGIITRYSSQLQELRALMNTTPRLLHGNATRDYLAAIRRRSHTFVTPYYSYPPWTSSNASLAFAPNAPSSIAALRRCRDHALPFDLAVLPSEVAVYRAFSEVTSAICDTTLQVFLATEAQWLTHFNNMSAPPPPLNVQREVLHSAAQSHRAVEELMAWLGWADQWTDCEPACGRGEYCYIPMFPIFGITQFEDEQNGTGKEREPRRMEDWVEEGIFAPKCIKLNHLGSAG